VQIPPAEVEPQWQGCHPEAPAPPGLIQPKPEPIENASVYRDNRAQLYTYNFAPNPNDKPTLTVSYLLWAPLTAQVKCDLEEEDNSAPQKQAFAAFAKDFIDDKLADALLYAGTYRKEVIRPSVQGALCKVTRGTWHADSGTCAPGDYRDPTVIITHSLGGYMLMDSIQAELRADDCRPNSGGVFARIFSAGPDGSVWRSYLPGVTRRPRGMSSKRCGSARATLAHRAGRTSPEPPNWQLVATRRRSHG
jgi:hypothetical protein